MSDAHHYVYDVFISYSSQDAAWVRSELLPRLEQAGLKVIIDFRDFEIGVPNLINIERAVDTSRHTLVVLTPNWIASAWTEFESLLVVTRDPISRQRRIIPLMVQKCDPPPRIAMLTYLDLTNTRLIDEHIPRLIKGLIHPIHQINELAPKHEGKEMTALVEQSAHRLTHSSPTRLLGSLPEVDPMSEQGLLLPSTNITTSGWPTQIPLLFIKQSEGMIVTELRIPKDRTVKGVMPLDTGFVESLTGFIRDLPRVQFRYTEKLSSNYAFNVGKLIFNNFISYPVKSFLRSLEPSLMGLIIDPELQYIPWELMVDEETALCIKYGFGRIVPNYKKNTQPLSAPASREIRVLILPSITLGFPSFVIDEVNTIAHMMVTANPDVQVQILGKSETQHQVIDKLYEGQDVVHCISHFLSDGLYFGDRILSYEFIAKVMHENKMSLITISACESGAHSANNPPSGYKLASYNIPVICPLTWIGDTTMFLARFYELVLNGETVGESLRSAKTQAFYQSEINLLTYIFYGDPSLRVTTSYQDRVRS